MSRWADETSRWDEDGCAFCGRDLERPRGGIGARICFDCARPEPTHEYKSDGNRRDPSCIHCGRYRLDALHSVRKPDQPAAVSAVSGGAGNLDGRGNEEA